MIYAHLVMLGEGGVDGKTVFITIVCWHESKMISKKIKNTEMSHGGDESCL